LDYSIFLITISAFVPCLLFAIVTRFTEVNQRQSFRSILYVFFLGMTVSVVLALILEIVGQLVLFGALGIEQEGMLSAFLGAAIMAPIIEEFTKSLPVRGVRLSSQFSEVEDGLIYGAVAGFGFAASENLLYFFVAWRRALLLPPALGVASLVATIIVRSVGAACLHGAASSMVGLGIGKSKFLRESWLPGYFSAVSLHAAYNFSLFAFGYLIACNLGALCPVPLLFSLAMGVAFFNLMLGKIRRLDRMPNVQPVYEWKDGPPDEEN
jgi:RsiW-degrading membrane proteinase PrsW (M82 family)